MDFELRGARVKQMGQRNARIVCGASLFTKSQIRPIAIIVKFGLFKEANSLCSFKYAAAPAPRKADYRITNFEFTHPTASVSYRY